jgi:hypothetical protein
MKVRLALLAILLASNLSVERVKADEATPTSISCSYSDSMDACGSTWITETCTTNYSNGTSSFSYRTYLSPSECWFCIFMPMYNQC